MTLCPIAIASGCRKCPMFSICPLKGVIGDYRESSEADASHPADKEKTEPVERQEKQ